MLDFEETFAALGSSGGGSGGTGYSSTLILSEPNGVTLNQEYTLLNGAKLSDFDSICLVISTAANVSQYNCYEFYTIDVTALLAHPTMNWAGYRERWMLVSFTNTSATQTLTGCNGESSDKSPYVYAIYGIKH